MKNINEAIKISIIIPIYKVDPYITRCIESVLHQTYRNLEVILVDDCSPDRSMELAKECIEASPLSKDLQFVYLKHDHNRGLSAARNTGIDSATGEYIYFLDSDDEITADCMERLSTYSLDGYEIIQGEFWRTDGIRKLDGKKSLSMTTNSLVFQAFESRIISQQATNKLCKRSFIIDNNLYFMEGLKNEDDLWNFQCLCYISSYYYLSECTYIYHIRPESIMTSYDKKDFILNLVNIYGLKVEFCLNNAITNPLAYHELRVFMLWIFGWNKRFRVFFLYTLYNRLRNVDKRNFMEKWRSYATYKEMIKYFYELLPVTMAFPFYWIKLLISMK